MGLKKVTKQAIERQRNNVTVFLDLDDTLCDFSTAAVERGYKDKLESWSALPEWVWSDMDASFWVDLQALDGALDFYRLVSSQFKTLFLTSPSENPTSHQGKAHWIKNNIPGDKPINNLILCPAPHKRFLAGPSRILVDDRPQNLYEWTDHGGHSILHKPREPSPYKETYSKLLYAVAQIDKDLYNPHDY